MRKYIFLIIIALLTSNNIVAQIEVNQVEVIKQFEAEIEEAEKINIPPVIVIPKKEKRKYKYDVTIIPLSLKYPEPEIKPLAMKRDDAIDTDQFYIKGGYGNRKNPYLKFRWGIHGDDKYEINAHVDYIDVDNSVNIKYQKMNDLDVGLDVKYRLKDNMQLKVGTDVSISERFFYFIYTDKQLSPVDKLKRFTNIYTVYGGIENIEPINEKIEYNLGARLSHINTTNFSANEQLLDIVGTLRYRFSPNFYLQVPLEMNTVRYDVIDVAAAQANFIADFNPHLVYHKGKFNIQFGGEFLHDKQANRVWPTIHMSYALLGKEFQIFAGTDQKKVINDLKNILEFAPWANSLFRKININAAKEHYAGVRGNFTMINYEGRVGFRQNTNQTLFTNYRVNALESNDKLSVDYTDMNTIFVNGNLDFQVSDIFTVGGALIKNFYTTKERGEAYGLLGLELNAWGKLKFFKEKLLAKSDLYIADRSVSLYPSANNLPTTVKGTHLFDLNFGLELWPTKIVGIYADVYNVLNNKNVRWYGYPQIGIHYNVGALVKF